MSTKTTIKRISLVAASALALGLLSSIPVAQASITGTATITPSNGTATLTNSDSTGAASVTVSFNSNTADTADTAVVSITGVAAAPTGYSGTWDTSVILMTALDTSGGTIVTTPKGKGAVATAWTVTNGPGTDSLSPTAGAKGISVKGSSTAGTASTKWGFFLDSALTSGRVAGTYTMYYAVTFYSDGVLSSGNGGSGSISIVVSDASAAAAGAVTASATSSALMYKGNSYGNTNVDSTVAVLNTPDSTADAVIRVTQKTAAGLSSRESITVTIDKGNVGDSSGPRGKSVTFVGNANGVNDINVYADGSTGVATITIKTTSVTFSNKSVTWYGGTVATIVATQLGKTLGATAANAILVVAKDSAGNQILGDTSVYAYSSDRTIIATGSSATTGTACTYVASAGGQICSLTGASNGTASITVWDASTTATRLVSSNALTFTVNSNAPVAIKLATDKSTYAPGEVAYVRVWAIDASGNPVAPGTYTNLLATGGITSTVATGNGSDTTTAVTFATAFTTAADGYASDQAIKLYKVYMPYTGGDITFSATGGTSLPTAGQVAVTTKASVTDNGAAALAAVTSLASQVSAFITKNKCTNYDID